jgi:hypothetical protein
MKKMYNTEIWNEKIENFHFWNWNENIFLKFEKIGHIITGQMKKIEMKKSYISFMPLR